MPLDLGNNGVAENVDTTVPGASSSSDAGIAEPRQKLSGMKFGLSMQGNFYVRQCLRSPPYP